MSHNHRRVESLFDNPTNLSADVNFTENSFKGSVKRLPSPGLVLAPYKEKSFKPLFYGRRSQNKPVRIFYELKSQEGKGSLPVIKNLETGWEINTKPYYDIPYGPKDVISSPY